MQIPRRAVQVVLVLGTEAAERERAAAICARAGILADSPATRATGLACFLDRGGHAAVFCVGGLDEELRALLATLQAIQPDLSILHGPPDADVLARLCRS